MSGTEAGGSGSAKSAEEGGASVDKRTKNVNKGTKRDAKEQQSTLKRKSGNKKKFKSSDVIEILRSKEKKERKLRVDHVV